MHKLLKPTVLGVSLVALSVTAGTAAAALVWLKPNSKLDKNSIVTLPNGNQRFWVNSDSCQGQDQTKPVSSYYEVKAGSGVTPDHVRDSIEAGCEDDLFDKLFPEVITYSNKLSYQNFKPYSKQYQSPWVQLKEVGSDFIVVDNYFNGVHYTNIKLPVDKGAKVFSKGQAIGLGDLKPGDWLTLVSYTESLAEPFSTETASAETTASMLGEGGFPAGTRVEGMIKRQYAPLQIIEGQKTTGGPTWTRLVEDKNSPDGWRQLISLDGPTTGQ